MQCVHIEGVLLYIVIHFAYVLFVATIGMVYKCGDILSVMLSARPAFRLPISNGRKCQGYGIFVMFYPKFKAVFCYVYNLQLFNCNFNGE